MRDKAIYIPFLILLLFTAIVICGSTYQKGHAKKWQVEVTYCDQRPPKVIIVETFTKPRSSDIFTRRVAVPIFWDELNVCSIRVLN